jgi:hypothetical protein
VQPQTLERGGEVRGVQRFDVAHPRGGRHLEPVG